MVKPLDIPILTKPRVSKPMQWFNVPYEHMPVKKTKKVSEEAKEKAAVKKAMVRLEKEAKRKTSEKKKSAKVKKEPVKKKKEPVKKKEVKKAVAKKVKPAAKQAVKKPAAAKKPVKAKAEEKKQVPTRRVLHATPTAGKRGTGFKWQFVENDNTWRDYLVDASAVVEQHYAEWDPADRNDLTVRAVQSGDWSYDVCFKTMKQTNADHHNHTVRKIRRVAQSTPSGQAVGSS
eukprot:TRINITY_DN4905_c0_g1_i1.p1 TRINITY_DN4905_c0_g1~~TRINITY_DN4905_c0_g1_i1.p1  ORF type:complete len:231 (+),score=96.16 TRINITY_DN4905_c0_g1_i1:56-748(+)